MNGIINIALTNLSEYNAGKLVYTWLELPASEEEIAEAYDKIRVSHDDIEYYDECGCPMEEAFITDYETEFDGVRSYGEYANIEDLNALAEALETMDADEYNAIAYLVGDDYALETIENGDYRIWQGCSTMAGVAYDYIEETGMLADVPDHFRSYFDYESFGRDLDIEGCFTYMGNNRYMEVFR